MLSASVTDIQLEKHMLWIPKYLPVVAINRFRSSCLTSTFQPSPDLLKINIYFDHSREAYWSNHFFRALLFYYCCSVVAALGLV